MTTIPQTEIGATLDPAALPAAVLAAIGACADACRATLTRLEGDRERLRGELSRRIRPAPDGPERRLCAVDGSHATVPAAGATFAAVAAVAVEEATLTDQQVLVQLLPPVEELETILGGLRTMLELRLLARRIRATSSGLFVLDGSFYSALLEVNRLLVRYAQDARGGSRPEWWAPFTALIEAFFAEQDWRLVLSCRRVIAHPKQATAADDVAQLAPHLSGTVTDRTLWSTVLEPGEHSLPVPLIKQDRPHLLTGYRSRPARLCRAPGGDRAGLRPALRDLLPPRGTRPSLPAGAAGRADRPRAARRRAGDLPRRAARHRRTGAAAAVPGRRDLPPDRPRARRHRRGRPHHAAEPVRPAAGAALFGAVPHAAAVGMRQTLRSKRAEKYLKGFLSLTGQALSFLARYRFSATCPTAKITLLGQAAKVRKRVYFIHCNISPPRLQLREPTSILRSTMIGGVWQGLRFRQTSRPKSL